MSEVKTLIPPLFTETFDVPSWCLISVSNSLFSGGSKGALPARLPSTDQNFLNFMQFFRKLGKNYMLALPAGRLGPSPMEILDPPLLFKR